MTISDSPSKTVTELPRTSRRSIADLLAPLEKIALESSNLVINRDAQFKVGGEAYELPRYLFVGPKGGAVPIHVGIFAGIHGDEPEGPQAIIQFIRILEAKPELATGYYLSFYPVCNPTGFEDGTRFSRRGKDLNREFWKNSSEPEVRLLQAELVSRSFQGIISLHADNTCDGFYGIACGATPTKLQRRYFPFNGSSFYSVVSNATLTEHLIEPALRAVEQLLPRDERPIIDGFAARRGIIRDTFDGILSAPPKVRPRPFEIILETPQTPPAYLKEAAFVVALQTILVEYQKFIAYATNL